MESFHAESPSAKQDEARERGGAAELRRTPVGGPDTPRLVIRGESSGEDTTSNGGESFIPRIRGNRALLVAHPEPLSTAHARGAFSDYLNVTFPFSGGTAAIGALHRRITTVFGAAFGGLEDRGKGLHGYHSSLAFEQGRVLFGYGGQRDTAFLSLPGEGCAMVPDWAAAAAFFKDELHARITRWDGAVDDYEGVHSVDDAVKLYLAGQFNLGGNKPSCDQAGNWIEPDGRGRTFYVGLRKNGKLMRIYEKGKQLGDPESLWVRWELELHNRSREIPFDVLIKPGQYVAGAYPCTAWVHDQASRIATIQKSSAIGYDVLIESASTSYGRLFNVMMEQEGSAEAVVDLLRRPGLPRRLEQPAVPDCEGFPEQPPCDP